MEEIILTKTFVKIKAIMGCACSKSLYEYSMDSSTEDLIKSYEQTQRDGKDCRKDKHVLLPPTSQKVVANLLGKLWVVISDAVDYKLVV